MRLPLALVLAGVLLVVVVNRLALGWPLYVVGVLAFAIGVGMLFRGDDEMTRSPEMAIGLSCLLVVGGVWLLHPQGWKAPGFALTGSSSHVQLLGRLKGTAVVEDKGTVRGIDISSHQQVWHLPATGQVTMQDRKVYFRNAGQATATAVRPATGSRFPTTLPWPAAVVATPTGQSVRRGHLWAKLVTAHDVAGDSYTSLVVHERNGAESSYRVKDVTSLSLRGGVLLLSGPTPRLLVVAKS